jgi:sulfite exporter TauE/SafE/plastocyanin domain-containing protein/copper chaperone CopZ
MQTQKVHVKGMHCRSCEILIEEELKKLKGVKKVSVDHQTGIADVVCKYDLDETEVKEAVQKAGYELGVEGKLPLFSRKRQDYIDLGIAFFITTALFLLARSLGIFNLGSSVGGSYSSLPVVFLIGLTAGVSTCMALVGGLVLGAAARFSAKHPQASGIEKFKPHLFFNLGRIISYFILGGIIGLAGSVFQLSSSVLGIMTVAVGLVMLLLGGQLVDIFPALKKISFTLPKSLHKVLGIKQQAELEYSNNNAALMGAMTFFLPCGFTQAMQLYAMSTGSPTAGALTMGVFALGTAPGLLSVGGLTSVIKGQSARLFFKTAGVVVILLALFNLSNGLNLLGINPGFLSAFNNQAVAKNSVQDPNVKVVNGVQEVRMTQSSSGYSPNKFTIKKGLPVKWIVNSTDSYSCASSLISQQLGIRSSLQPGENIFEFTPTQTGKIRFSCSMGMYTGTFEVVDENSQVSAATTNNVVKQNTAGGASCGMGGGGGCGGCGGAKKNTSTSQQPGETTTQGNVQIIKATYTLKDDILPNKFTVKANQPVKFEIAAKDDGQGCMSSITIPNLTKQIELFTKNETLTFEFTPTQTGTYNITCAMGVPRGQIQVI